MPKSEETQAQSRHSAFQVAFGNWLSNSSFSFHSLISEVGIIAAVSTYRTVSFVIKYLLSIHMYDTKSSCIGYTR